MKKTTTLDFISIEDIKVNWDKYKDILLKEGVFVFRNANISLEEQKSIQAFIGTSLHCWPSEEDFDHMEYVETHEIIQQTIKANKDEVLLNWHIEHAEFDNPMVLGVWNMEIFTTQPGHGNTVFVNTTDLYNKLPREDRDFLKSTIAVFPSTMIGTNLEWSKEELIKNDLLTGPFIREHWVTKEPIVRISFWVDQWLSHMNNRETTEEDRVNFKRLFDYFWKEVKENQENWVVQEWQQGDLLIVDLEKMAHTVLGGFDPKDRKLQGTFSYEYNNRLVPEIDLDRRK